MTVKLISASVFAAAFGVALVAVAPAFADLRGPAELPPASFKGQQYTDSRGCVFLRAGYGGQISWVPRVSRDRKQLCGNAPSGKPVEVERSAAAAPPPDVKPEPAAQIAAPAVLAPTNAPQVKLAVRPAPVQRAPKVAAAPLVMPAPPVTKSTPTGMAAPQVGYQLACPSGTPHPQRFDTTTGGTVVLCTKGDGSLAGANFPRMVAGSLAGQRIGYDAHTAAASPQKDGALALAAPATPQAPVMTPPPGYKAAWEDDRLNPKRGPQTAQGVQDQDQIWTRTAPAELRADLAAVTKSPTAAQQKKTAAAPAGKAIVVSTKSEARSAVAPRPIGTKTAANTAANTGSADQRLLVQIGSFGVASNADAAAARLRGQGLPVARGKAAGGRLAVIYAGPFASAAEATSALAAARGMGFSDAVITR